MNVGDRVVLNTKDTFNGETGVITKVVEPDGFNVHVDQRPNFVNGFHFDRTEVELVPTRVKMSDGSDRVVFVGDSPIKIVFPDKPVLELTNAEAVQVLRQLDAVLL